MEIEVGQVWTSYGSDFVVVHYDQNGYFKYIVSTPQPSNYYSRHSPFENFSIKEYEEIVKKFYQQKFFQIHPEFRGASMENFDVSQLIGVIRDVKIKDNKFIENINKRMKMIIGD